MYIGALGVYYGIKHRPQSVRACQRLLCEINAYTQVCNTACLAVSVAATSVELMEQPTVLRATLSNVIHYSDCVSRKIAIGGRHFCNKFLGRSKSGGPYAINESA